MKITAGYRLDGNFKLKLYTEVVKYVVHESSSYRVWDMAWPIHVEMLNPFYVNLDAVTHDTLEEELGCG